MFGVNVLCLYGSMIGGCVADGEMLKKLVDDVLSGVFSRGELEQKIPRVEGMLHDVVLRDRAISWGHPRLEQVPQDPMLGVHRRGSMFVIPIIIN